MYKPADMALWRGPVHEEAITPTYRWDQKIQSWDQQRDLKHATVLLGFASDEGVRRNKGRLGARDGPRAIRRAIANMAYFQDQPCFDAGDVLCNGQNLEQAQILLAEKVTQILQFQGFPIVLGGGHEVAWGSFLGLVQHLEKTDSKRRIGIVNFDAHLDLRNPEPQANSGSAFRQIAHWCESSNRPFNYLVFGINPAANTQPLFEFAKQHQVVWFEDAFCSLERMSNLKKTLASLMKKIDVLYLTVCLDVFPASVAPGVSAPSALGVEPIVIIQLIKILKQLCNEQKVKFMMADIAEMNPQYDQAGITARLAARLVHEFVAQPMAKW